MFKISKYCIPIENEGQMIVFNTMTSSVIKMDKEMFHRIFELNIMPDDKNTLQALEEMGYIVDSSLDENFRLMVSRRKYQFSNSGITSAVIAVTTECNARCYYCYENGIERAAMDVETADNIVDFLDKNSRTRKLVIQWFGGEPLCAVDTIDRIATGLKSRGIEFASLITTNGYCVNDEILKKARDAWNVKRFQIPIDALGEEYDKIKNYVESSSERKPFDIVIKNIHSILAVGFHVNVRTNFNPKNIETTRKVLNFLAEEFKDQLVIVNT